MNNKPVVLYHAYGLKDLYSQVIFSVLTLFHHLQENAEQVTCVIYTDDLEPFKKYLKDFPVAYELLAPDKIKEYRGPFNFVHRVKVCVIQDCISKYKSNVLYMDADTYFLKSPLDLIRSISPGTTIMNLDAYDMLDGGGYEEESWLQMRKIVKENYFELEGRKFKFPMTTRMWNAGIIGLDYSHLPLLEKVLDLTDQIYKASPVFTAEQFAFSYILQTQTRLQSTEDYILHYWPNAWPNPQKILYNYHFRLFFRNYAKLNGRDLAKEAYKLTQRREELRLPPKTLLEKISFRLKIIAQVALKGRITTPNY